MGTPKPRRGRPPASTGDVTRAAVLHAARERFAALGYEATSMKQIAVAAGVTPPALYHYFASKQDLFRAAITDCEGILAAAYGAALRGKEDFASRIDALAVASRDLFDDDPALGAFLANAQIEIMRHPDLVREGGPEVDFGGVVTMLVAEASAAGEFAPGVDSEALAAFLLATTFGVSLYASMFDPALAGRMIEEFRRLVAAGGLTAGPAEPDA